MICCFRADGGGVQTHLVAVPRHSATTRLPTDAGRKVKGVSDHLGPSSLQQPKAQNPEDNWEASSQHIIPGPLKVPMQYPTEKAPRSF